MAKITKTVVKRKAKKKPVKQFVDPQGFKWKSKGMYYQYLSADMSAPLWKRAKYKLLARKHK